MGNDNTPARPSPAVEQLIVELKQVQDAMTRAANALGDVAQKLRTLSASKAL